MRFGWSVGVVLLVIVCVGVGVGAGDGLLLEVGAGRFRWCYWRRAWVATLFMSRA